MWSFSFLSLRPIFSISLIVARDEEVRDRVIPYRKRFTFGVCTILYSELQNANGYGMGKVIKRYEKIKICYHAPVFPYLTPEFSQRLD